MNFKINDQFSDKIYQRFTNIFEHIEKKLNILRLNKKAKATLK